MNSSRTAELINTLIEFEKKIEDIKKEIIKKGTSALLEIADKQGADINRYAEELLNNLLAELKKQIEEEKKRIEEIKAIEKKSILERLESTARSNKERAVEETFREALRLLGYDESF